MAELSPKQPYVSIIVYKAKYANFKPNKAYLVFKSSLAPSESQETAMQVASYVREWPTRFIVKLQEEDLAAAKLFVEVWRPASRLKSASCVKSFDFNVNSLVNCHSKSDDHGRHVIGSLEIFVQALGPRAFLDRAKFLLQTAEDDLESQEALIAMLEDFQAMLQQDKHKTATYITEELVKTFVEILQRFAPLKSTSEDNKKDDVDVKDNGENGVKKSKSPRDGKKTPSSSRSKPSTPKTQRERRKGDTDDDDEEPDASEAKTPKGKKPPSRSASQSRKAPRKKKESSSDSDSSSSDSSDSEDSSSDGEAERLAAESRLAAEERSRKLADIRIRIRKMVIQTFTNAAEADISLVRKLIAAGYIRRVRKLLSSRSFDEESLVSLLNSLKPFFIVRSHQKALVDDGILAALIKFVSRSTTKSGANALQYASVDLLMYFDESYQRELLNAGVLSAALRLLATGTPQIRTRALELLFFFNKNYQEDMVNEGILSQIISLLNLSDEASLNASNKQVLSSLLLRSLSVVSRIDKSYHADLVAAGIFPRLISLLSIKDEKLQQSCCDILSSFEEKYLSQMIESKYMQAVLSLLDEEHAASTAISAWAFRKAAQFCDKEATLPKILEAGIVQSLVQKIIGSPSVLLGTEIRCAAFLLLHELPITFEQVDSVGFFQIITQYLTWAVKFLDIHTYYPSTPFAWVFQRAGLLKHPPDQVQEFSIGLFKLSLSSLINFVVVDPENCKFESLKPALDAALELPATRTAVADPNRVKEKLVYEFLLSSTKIPSARQYLIEEKRLLSSVLDFVTQVKEPETLALLKKIPDSHRILCESSVLVKLIEFLSEDSLSATSLDLMRLVDRESLAQKSVVTALAEVALGRNTLKSASGLAILEILSQIAPICTEEVSQILVGPTAIAQFVKFIKAHKTEVSNHALQYLETVSRFWSSFFSITNDLVKFLLQLVKESAVDLEATSPSSNQKSSLFSFSISSSTTGRGKSSSDAPKPSSTPQPTVIGGQRTWVSPSKFTLGSARGGSSATQADNLSPRTTSSLSSSSSNAASVTITTSAISSSSSSSVDASVTSQQPEDDPQRGCAPLALLLRLICAQGTGDMKSLDDLTIGQILRSNESIYKFFGSKENAPSLAEIFRLLELGPRLSKPIRDFLVDFIALCPQEHHAAFFSSSLVPHLVAACADMKLTSSSVEEYVLALLNALRRFGSAAWADLVQFITNIENFIHLFTLPSALIRSCATSIFFEDMNYTIQSNIIDEGLLDTAAVVAETETQLWRDNKTLQYAPDHSKFVELQLPLVRLLEKLDDKHYFAQTHIQTPPTPVAPKSPETEPSELPDDCKLINQWLNNVHSWRVQYAASKDGWTPEKFYARCKDCGPNLVIVRTSAGSIFGAYTAQSWNPSNNGRPYSADATAFLFTLNSKLAGTPSNTKLAIKTDRTAQAIYASYSGVGPAYGDGHDFVVDLRAKALRGVLGYTFNTPSGTGTSSVFWGMDPLAEVTVYTIKSAAAVPIASASEASPLLSSSSSQMRPEKRYQLLNRVFTRILTFFESKVGDEYLEDIPDDIDEESQDDPELTFSEAERLWDLQYRSSVDRNWSQFVSSSTESPGLLIIVRCENGAMFGGFTGLERSKVTLNAFKEDSSCFLFSIKPTDGTKRQAKALRLRDPSTPSVMFLSDGIAFGQGFDLRINILDPSKSFSNLGVSFQGAGDAFSAEALNFFAGSPSRWDVTSIDVFGLMSKADKESFSRTQRIYASLRSLFAGLAAYSTPDTKSLHDLLDTKLASLMKSQRTKVLGEIQRVVLDSNETPEIRNVLKPRLMAAKLPNLSIIPYKVVSSLATSPRAVSTDDSWRKEYAISQATYVESPGNIILQYDDANGKVDVDGQPPYLTHFLVGVDILGGNSSMHTVPAKRVLIFASDTPFDEAQLSRFDKPHVAMGHDPDDVKAAYDLSLLQQFEELLEQQEEERLEQMRSVAFSDDIHAVGAAGVAAAAGVDSTSTESSSDSISQISDGTGTGTGTGTITPLELDELMAELNGTLDFDSHNDMKLDIFADAAPQPKEPSQIVELPWSSSQSSSSVPLEPKLPIKSLSRSFRSGSRNLRASAGRGEQGQLVPIASLIFGDTSYDEVAVKLPCSAKYLLIKVLADPTRRDNINGTVCISAFAAVGYTPPPSRIPSPWPLPPVDIQRSTEMGASTVWQNPAATGKVRVKLSHTLFNPTTMKAIDVLGSYQDPVACFWGGSTPTFCIIDLGIVSLNASHYSLRHGYNYSNSFMQDFRLEGSNDGDRWETLHEQVQTPFASPHAKASFPITSTPTCTGVGKFFRYFRIFQKGHYFMGANSTQKTAPFLCINGVEFYGEIKLEENILAEPPLFSERHATLKMIQDKSLEQANKDAKGKEKDL